MKRKNIGGSHPLWDASYRLPMSVAAVRCYSHCRNNPTFSLCPRCDCTMEREYQSFCDSCGQALGWEQFSKAIIILS